MRGIPTAHLKPRSLRACRNARSGHSRHQPARTRSVCRRLSPGRPHRWRSQVCTRLSVSGTRALAIRTESLVQLSGRNRRRPTITGTSPLANVAETSVWQLAVLPRVEAYCAATPTEWLPFFGRAVSSITNTALSPPTSRSAWTRSSASSGAASHTPPDRNDAADRTHRGPPLRHRLNALPLARSDQSGNVERAHPSSGLVRKAGQEWLQPALRSPFQPATRRLRKIAKPTIRRNPFRTPNLPK